MFWQFDHKKQAEKNLKKKGMSSFKEKSVLCAYVSEGESIAYG